MSFFGLFPDSKEETHTDGSVTERYEGGTLTTRDANGHVRESTSHETGLPLGYGTKFTVTRDGDGKTINVQRGWGK